MKESSLLHELLTRGIAPYTPEIALSAINKKLRCIKYEAVLWFDKSCVILKDREDPNKIQLKWRQHLVMDSIKIIEAIIKKELCYTMANKEVLNLLEEKMWIEKDGPDYKLGKKFLVQNSDYLLSVSDRYRNCKLCGLLVEDRSCHQYCEGVYENELKSQKENFEGNRL